ncbi:MAG: hypothetical protein GX230_03415 [Lentisphaerae bacterium]|nr:hypothetical protein [Lentisphaerota bacterium]
MAQDGSATLHLLGEKDSIVWSGTQAISAGSEQLLTFAVPSIEAGCNYDFAVFDEVGKIWFARGVEVAIGNRGVTEMAQPSGQNDSGALSASGGVTARAAVKMAAPMAMAAASATLPQTWIGNGPRIGIWQGAGAAERVRLSLRYPGLYRVTASELAAAAGWSESQVVAAIGNYRVALSCQGVPVAWLADGDAMVFYGAAATTQYAPENVYWVEFGEGLAMGSIELPPPEEGVANTSFADSVTFQGSDYLARVTYGTLTNAPFVAFSGVILSGASVSHSFNLPSCAAGAWSGSVTVRLLSYREKRDNAAHNVEISLGGELLGETSWLGEQYHEATFPFDSALLNNGLAVLKLRNAAARTAGVSDDDTRFICVAISFNYQREYRLDNGSLRCNGGDGDLIEVSGVASDKPFVLDVTAPQAPLVVTGAELGRSVGSDTTLIRFANSDSGRTFQIVDSWDGLLLPAVRGAGKPLWLETAAASLQHITLIPPVAWYGGFREALAPLAAYRNSHGMRATVIDVEEVYNTYSHGLVDPLAIRSLAAALQPSGLKYLLLVGSAAFDFKHERLTVGDYSAWLMPTLVVGQSFLEGNGMVVPLDAALGDIDNDGKPEVAVGRIPAANPAAAAVVVNKTIAYETGRRWRKPLAVVADWDNSDERFYRFGRSAGRIEQPLRRAGRSYKRFDLGNSSGGEKVRNNDVLPMLRSGASIFHFFGHTNEQNLGDTRPRFLSNAHISAANWQDPMIAIIPACRANRWQGLTATATFMPYGLFAAGTGFAAGIGSTGNILGREGEELAVEFYAALCQDGTRLGEAMLQATQATADTIPAERLLSVSLVGDPALMAAMPVAQGTIILIR